MGANWIDRALASVAPGAARKRLLERQAFEKLARWPVSMSYFKVGSGESTPSYTISFELYENATMNFTGGQVLVGQRTSFRLPSRK